MLTRSSVFDVFAIQPVLEPETEKGRLIDKFYGDGFHFRIRQCLKDRPSYIRLYQGMLGHWKVKASRHREGKRCLYIDVHDGGNVFICLAGYDNYTRISGINWEDFLIQFASASDVYAKAYHKYGSCIRVD